jgi:hypothetical protein
LSFIKRCRLSCCHAGLPIPIITAFIGVVLLVSLICGTFVVYVGEIVKSLLPSFCIPMFFLSLLVLISHTLLAVMLCLTLFDNFRCRINRLISVCIIITYVLSIAYMNLFRVCYYQLLLLWQLCLCLYILHSKRGGSAYFLCSY